MRTKIEATSTAKLRVILNVRPTGVVRGSIKNKVYAELLKRRRKL